MLARKIRETADYSGGNSGPLTRDARCEALLDQGSAAHPCHSGWPYVNRSVSDWNPIGATDGSSHPGPSMPAISDQRERRESIYLHLEPFARQARISPRTRAEVRKVFEIEKQRNLPARPRCAGPTYCTSPSHSIGIRKPALRYVARFLLSQLQTCRAQDAVPH